MTQDEKSIRTVLAEYERLLNASGDETPESNRELFVFAQEGGAWRIARYMFNKAA